MPWSDSIPPHGTVLAERFRLGVEIGRGGMGVVFESVDISDNTPVAVKFLCDEDSNSRARFEREIKSLQAIDHPHVIKILFADLDFEVPYFVMPRMRGSLENIIPNIYNDISKVLALFQKICDSVEAIHSKEKIHRDIKPSNFLMDDDFNVYISDFGLIRALTSQDTTLTGSREMIGTMIYCSPEQLADPHNVDKRTDIFSLGKTLQEMLTNKDPILLSGTLTDPLLISIIEKATKDQRDRRYPSVSSLKDAVMSYVNIQSEKFEPEIIAFEYIENLNKMIKDTNKYDPSLLEKALLTIASMADQDKIIEAINKLDRRLLSVSAQYKPELLYRLIESKYLTSIEERIGRYHFSMAEDVASSMAAIFQYSRDLDLKVVAIEVALVAASALHRFAAMDTVKGMIIEAGKDPVLDAKTAQMLAGKIAHFHSMSQRLDEGELGQAIKQEKRKADIYDPYPPSATDGDDLLF